MERQFRCKNCNYSFKSQREMIICPNCGEKNSIVEERDAQDLLDEL